MERPGLGAKGLGERQQLLLAHLDQVEAEMKRIAFWSNDPPDLQAEYAAGRLNTFLDAPSFELWLQCVFLPNARQAVRENNIPSTSQVGVMAMRQYDYHSSRPEAHPLMQLLNKFDRLAERHSR